MRARSLCPQASGSVCPSVCVSVRYTCTHFLMAVTHSYVSQATHAFLGMLSLCLLISMIRLHFQIVLLCATKFSISDKDVAESKCAYQEKCTCLSMPSSGRLLADCSNLNLTAAPKFAGNVTDIDLSFNKLWNLSIEHPSPYKLLHLNIAHNEISTIVTENNQSPFLQFSELQSLNLSSNGIKLTETNFHDHVFVNLSKLEVLDISNNTKLNLHIYNSTQTLDKVWLPLLSLRKLMVDGLQNVTFGYGVSTLKNLTHLTLAGRCSKARLRFIDENYFKNFPYIETLDLSSQYAYNIVLQWYDMTYCSLYFIHRCAIAKLKYLKYLDISYNRYLGLCGFRNTTYDLPDTSIKIFNASYLQCETGMSLTVYCDDVSPLVNTSMEELYFDGNHASFGQYGLLQYFPSSLKILSVKGIRWVRARYAYIYLEDVTGLHSLDISGMNEHQISHSYPFYENCDNFVADINCEKYRSTHTRINGTGYCSSNTVPAKAMQTALEFTSESLMYDEKSATHSMSPGCSPKFVDYYSKVHIFKVPPKLSVLKCNKARMGHILDWVLFQENTLISLVLSNNEFYRITGPICNATKNETFRSIAQRLFVYLNICVWIFTELGIVASWAQSNWELGLNVSN